MNRNAESPVPNGSPSTSHVLSPNAFLHPLDQTIPAGSSVVAGTPTARLALLGGPHEVGIWEMTPGTAEDTEADECFVVLAGRATLTFADGEVVDLAPGVVVRLHEGDRTTWTVHETLRKMYVA